MEFQRILAALADYPRRKWYTSVINSLTADIASLFTKRSAVISGGVAADVSATVSASALGIDVSAVSAVVNGNLKTTLAALDDVDLFTTASSVGQAVFGDGATAAAISLSTDETAYVTLIATDSDGAGSATGDNGALIYVACVAGAADTYEAATAYLTDAEIRAALLASTGVHAGAGGFVRLADILWDENSGSPQYTVTINRDA